MWSPDYCLACDRQTTGGAYCSEGCRLADVETSSCNSEPPTPAALEDSTFWARSTNLDASPIRSGLYLQPAFDFGAYRSSDSLSGVRRTQPAYRTASFSPAFHTQTPPNPLPTAAVVLSPSASQTSLQSVQSRSSWNSGLSAQAKDQLRTYTNSFDYIRNWRRRMTSSR